MQAVRAYLGLGQAELPDDAAACMTAVELLHAVRTGCHPAPGGLGRQRASYAREWHGALIYAQHAAIPRRQAGGDGGPA